MATRGTHAATGKTRADRIPGPRAGFRLVEPGRGTADGLTRPRLGRGQEHRHRVSLAELVQQLPELASELVRMNVDVIFAASSTMVEPARRATKTIPIVFSNHADPIGSGHVASLPRPGGNITGLSELTTELNAKAIEMLKEAVPQATRIGVLWNPTTPSQVPGLELVKAAGEKLGLALHMVAAATVEDFDEALALVARERVSGLFVVPAPITTMERARLAELALKYRLPTMFGAKENVEAGGLDELRRRPQRSGSARRCLHRQDPQGRQACGPPG